MIRRYAVSIALAVVVTLIVLFMMQALIATAKGRLDESGTRHFVDFVRVEREESVTRKERRPDKPQEPEAPPPQAMQPRTDSVDPGDVTVSIPVAPVDMQMSVEGLGLATSDGDFLPIVKIAPAYPMTARTRGIQGYCIVEYTVGPTGSVKDVIVIDSEPKGVFDKASIEAAMKFKYRPRVVDGEPIEVRGVRNIFNYKLEGF